jgi:carboxypeptidase Taq
MQDVHWPSGAFGYFPAYTLGRLMAAQLFTTFTHAYPLYQEDIRQGRFQGLITWLHENVYGYASSLSIDALLSKVTGQSLNPNYFLQHIKRRYLNLDNN